MAAIAQARAALAGEAQSVSLGVSRNGELQQYIEMTQFPSYGVFDRRVTAFVRCRLAAFSVEPPVGPSGRHSSPLPDSRLGEGGFPAGVFAPLIAMVRTSRGAWRWRGGLFLRAQQLAWNSTLPLRAASAGTHAEADRHIDDPHHRRGADHHRSGLRIRLFRHSSLQGFARRGLSHCPDRYSNHCYGIATDPDMADRTYIEARSRLRSSPRSSP